MSHSHPRSPIVNPDRATLNFLNKFPKFAKSEGERIQREGNVTQIFGNHLFIKGRVEENEIHRTTLKLEGNAWVGSCSSGDSCSAALYATMLERLARGGDLPESPSEIDSKPLLEVIEDKLGRTLEVAEEQFVDKLERRYRRFEMEQDLFDHDLVRLNTKWPVSGYDALSLWPTAPTNIIEFWNYIAHAFVKKQLSYPKFMESVTDLEATQAQMESWERNRELAEWQDKVDALIRRPPAIEFEEVEFRLMITFSEVRLEAKNPAEVESTFAPLSPKGDFNRYRKQYDAGALKMDSSSELIWLQAVEHEQEGEGQSGRHKLESEQTCCWLARLFSQELLRESLVTLDENPYQHPALELKWVCDEEENDPEEIALQMVATGGERVTHSTRILPGTQNLYLSDEAVLPGPPQWTEGTEVLERYIVPRSILESERGVEFLHSIGADLPKSLQGRVEQETLSVLLDLRITEKITGAESEHLMADIRATSISGNRSDRLVREGWKVETQEERKDGKIHHYDRSMLHRFPAALEPMNLAFDNAHDVFKTRLVRNFPERFSAWIESLGNDVEVKTDKALASILADPVSATVRFEVTHQEIDWFDLKVVVDVEGHDLTQQQIKSLVQARGGFVRLKDGGWMRLQIKLEDDQRDAVARLGLDPFDLSGETHRMHALQLAEPAAKEVFDEAVWDRISERAANIKLSVSPKVPADLQIKLRPYQIEGFHFLAYLATNNFGGILADDMGLGKTAQSLTWLLWLRERAKEPTPAMVVCPKSVLDVWAGEVEKFAPSLRVQVLRNRDELDIEVVRSKVDLLVINYAQLRGCGEELAKINWLALILDEGQQIKNPDSKAAKSSRQLEAENRLVLTGTPIENRLLDIWSLMAFAMPGVLGNRPYFRERFDKRKDPQSQIRLAARLRPFMLRRTKDQVAMDLPPRTEEDVLCKLEGAQADLYQAELKRIQKSLLGLDSSEKLRKNTFVVLQGLMRLRQICCHPALVDKEQIDNESAKLTALFYLLDQLREEGHKVLVFSQFVRMLDIIRARLDKENRTYHYLTGQTKDRREVIEGFQTCSDPSVFLLSLKAGGSGLNLTAASYVILYDPWWNPAVESQAIDRTHRIGQTNRVIAYRLVMRDSIEEKIRILQQQKQAMTNGVLGEEGFASTLEPEDFEVLVLELITKQSHSDID